MGNVLKIEDADYFDLLPMNGKKATVYTRNGERFLYCGDTKLLLGTSLISATGPLSSALFTTTPIDVRRDEKYDGEIGLLMYEERYFLFYHNSFSNKQPVTVLKTGDLLEGEAA